jgi:integrase/recombinase XerD
MDLSTATTEMVAEYLAMFPRANTRHAYRSDIDVFYTWAVKRKVVEHNPVELIDPIRVPKTLPRPVAEEHIPMLIATAPSEMVRLAVVLAAYAGLRVSEIAKLDASDIDLANSVLMVRDGKGNKDRRIPLHPTARQMLAPAIKRGGRVVPYAKNSIGVAVSAHLHAQGLDASCHKLRGSFATNLAKVSNGNVTLVQHLLGHADPATTMRYVGWNGGEASALVAKLYQNEEAARPQ